MAKIELRKSSGKSSSSKSSSSSSKSEPKKVVRSYTTTSGEKVVKYSDGTEKRTGGSSSSSSASSTPQEKLADIQKQAEAIQKGLDAGVASGQIKTNAQVEAEQLGIAPEQTPLTPEAIAEALADQMPEQAQGATVDDVEGTEDNQITNSMVDEGTLPQSQRESFSGSRGGQVQRGNMQTPSIVDYLGSIGQPSDFNSRKALAGQYGIQGYTGTAQQNTQLLGALRGAAVTPEEKITPDSAGGVLESTEAVPTTPPLEQSWLSMQEKFGLTQTQNDFFSDPLKTIGDISKQVFKAMGLDQANSAIEEISEELEDLENDRDEELREINDDPWLTEGVRLRQRAKVEQKWADKIDSRVNKLSLLESVRDDAQQQSQFALGTAIALYDSERRFQADQIQAYYDRAQTEFSNQIALQELALKMMPQAEKPTAEVQEYIFSVEQGFTGSFLDYKMAVAAAGRAPSSGGGGGLTPIQLLGFTNQVEDNFRANPAAQNYTQLVNFGVPSVIQELQQNPSSVNDTILMRTLAKITDPTTGVREGEYETFESATGAINRVFVLPKAWIGKGRLTDLGRQQMGNLVKSRFTAAQDEYVNQYNYYNNQAAQVGATLPPPYQVSQQAPTYGPVDPRQTFDSIAPPPGTHQESSGGFFSSFLNGLFGR